MDILTHTFTGIAVGTVVSSFVETGFVDKLKVILISGFGGALPDLDAVSLWSGFDGTLGTFFDLKTSGKDIYSGKFWYSHHAFLHSIAGAFLMSVFLGIDLFLLSLIFKGTKSTGFLQSVKGNRWVFVGFFLGFTMHLIEDMPTPAASWGGVRLFWPSQKYIGGTGDIWWWNNYDIFLIVILVIATNFLLHLMRKFKRFELYKITIGVFFIGFALALFQIKTRPYDFAYSGHSTTYQESEQMSKEIQKDILGERLFRIMEKFDGKVKVFF